ncbi:hypothetical protein KSP35_15665 [Aquihabitans sp. G128]|uniref:ATP-binding protein n=1 Tax=Aquihabitans sp. G128 TaxID=2849779 RepID=UPI001C25129A|nr:ATP-binding protein [Aquihabitans sp. G128]QXC59808.1 hypothetical protein KSP35_15665 [Aquihabitans sp. G128]
MVDTLSDQLAHVRKRPGMYIGGTGPGGLTHLVMEVVANSFDQVLGGHATRIAVHLAEDGWVTVDDDGPGISIAAGPDGTSFLERSFTSFRDTATATADGHVPHVHLSVGIGLGPVCALSAELEVEVRSPAGTHRQSFAQGWRSSALERVGPATASGTTVRFLPDPAVFDGAGPSIEGLAEHLRALAHLTPGLTTELSTDADGRRVFGPVDDLRPAYDHEYSILAHDGWRIPDPPLLLHFERDRNVVDLALGWDGSWKPAIRSYGNYVSTVEGGRHEEGIEEGLREVFGRGPMGEVLKGLRALLHVKMLDIEFPGPTRQRLASPAAVWLVADAIADGLPRALREHPELDADLRSRVLTRSRVGGGARRG